MTAVLYKSIARFNSSLADFVMFPCEYVCVHTYIYISFFLFEIHGVGGLHVAPRPPVAHPGHK